MLVKIFRADRVPGKVYEEKQIKGLEEKWKAEQSGDIRSLLADLGLSLVSLNVSAREPGVMLVTATAIGGQPGRRKPVLRAGRPVEEHDVRRKATSKGRSLR